MYTVSPSKPVASGQSPVAGAQLQACDDGRLTKEMRPMLTGMRKFAKSPWALVIFGVLAVALVMTMGNDPFAGISGGGFVRAGDRSINISDANRAVDGAIENVRLQDDRVISRQEAAEQGVVGGVLQQLIQQTVTLAYADKLGVRASPQAVSDFLENDAPIFKDALGRVDMNRVAEFAGQRNMTVRQFQAELKDSLTINYMLRPLDIGVTPPTILTNPISVFLGEKRTITIARLPLEAIPEPATPTDAELQAFYSERSASFAVPERRRVSLIAYSPTDYIDRVALKPELIQSEYDRRIREFSTPETREIVQATSADRNAIQAVIDSVKQGMAFEQALAQAQGVGVATLTVRPADLTDPQYSELVFAIPVGEAFGPVQVGEAWYAVQVKTVTPGVATPLEQVSEQIRLDLAEREAQRLYNESRDTFEGLVGQGSPLEEISVEIGAPVISLAPVDGRGQFESGTVSELLNQPGDAMSFMFQTDVGATTEVIESDNMRMVVRLDEVMPSTTRPLEEVRDDVRALMMDIRRRDAARAIAQSVLAQVTGGTELRAAGEAARMQVVELPPVSRAEQSPLPPIVMERAFGMALNETAVVEGQNAEPWLVKVGAIQPLGEGGDANLTTQVNQMIQQSLGNDLREAFARSIQREVSVKVNEKAIQDYIASFIPEESAP